MRLVCVAGTRPNFVKVKPVVDALQTRGADTVLVHTGQHYSTSMSDVFFDDLGIRRPDFHLGVGAGSHAEQTARIMLAFEPVITETRPDRVVVVGDVNSTVAAALVAAKLGVPVSHVEAGLRSRDWSMPEEVNRVVTDRLSDQLFAPSPDAVENLRSEGFADGSIYLVGNVMIDTLLANQGRAGKRLQCLRERLGIEGPYALVTLHRPSNVDDRDMLRAHLDMLSSLSVDLPVVFPVHPRTRARVDAAGMRAAAGVHLVEPFGYLDFLALQTGAAIILTDSGGIQEEATALGKPCLTLRENTERPITISAGTNILAGTQPERVLELARGVLANGVEPRRPDLWDGHAAERIADVMLGSTAS